MRRPRQSVTEKAQYYASQIQISDAGGYCYIGTTTIGFAYNKWVACCQPNPSTGIVLTTVNKDVRQPPPRPTSDSDGERHSDSIALHTSVCDRLKPARPGCNMACHARYEGSLGEEQHQGVARCLTVQRR